MPYEQIGLICSKLMRMFEEGSFPAAAARTVIAKLSGDKKPCNSWSFCNQLIMLLSGTADARGFRQWQQINRQVNTGSKAVYILAPIIKRFIETVVDPITNREKEEEH